MPDDTPTPGTDAPGTAQGAPGTGGQQVDWQTKATEWQQRFTGLQGRFQKEQNRAAELQAQLQEAQDKLTALMGEKDEVSTKFTGLNEQHGSLTKEHAASKVQLERLKLIAMEYADLLPLEMQGLLPDGAGDELKGKLAAYRTFLQAQTQQAQAKMAADATPPPAPPAQGSTNPEDLMKQAVEALRKGDVDTYNQLSAEFYKLKK